MVRISPPAACATGTRQLLTSAPSSRTEHAPHSPSPQPSFVPVSASSLRSASSNRSIGHARKRRGEPFTVHAISILAEASGTRPRGFGRLRGGRCFVECFHDALGRRGNFADRKAGGIFDRVQNRRRGTIDRKFA